MKKHATENADVSRTLCGRPLPATVDNAFPDCGACKRVIRSRCYTHNVRRCRVCPPGSGIGTG